jgi:hypothetical protein
MKQVFGQHAGCSDLYFGQHLRKIKKFQYKSPVYGLGIGDAICPNTSEPFLNHHPYPRFDHENIFSFN